MSQLDYSHMFTCPRCGIMGAIFLVKLAGSQMIIKQRCPTHGGRVIKLPLLQKDLVLPYIRNAVFKCFKCGQDASIYSVKIAGPWTIIKCNCPTHANKVPNQKIWSTIYAEITSMPGTPAPAPVATPAAQVQPAQPEPASSGNKMFCPNCGTPMDGSEKFCGDCGTEID